MKVLVFDDHAYNRELLGFMLEDHGHDIVYAINGQEAVADDEKWTIIMASMEHEE